jgi:RimJ/RimL family protein N-acetyltransferase
MSGGGYWLTTARLALRRFTPGDMDWLAELYSDPDVMRYLGGVKDRAKAEELLDTRILKYYQEHPGLGIWTTVERATGTRLGFHLLNHIRGESIVQVGFTLEKSAWRKGFGTEWRPRCCVTASWTWGCLASPAWPACRITRPSACC